MVSVTITPRAAAEFERLPRTIKSRMAHLLKRLESWPNVSGVKPLRGRHAGRYRIRTGDYRLLFRVEGTELIVEVIRHRARSY